ncbi:MAG: hypothetical protein JW939_10130 [Candidatus Thermoplasmatota archaeon]|nr:hypothetical protein [Candidatus Thermoplasmatota archaeon]
MARGKKRPNTLVEFDPGGFRDEYLSRFLKDGDGTIKGETIDIDGDELVLKSGGDFFMIPISSVELASDFLLLNGNVDWKRAKELGERWRTVELDLL